MATPSCAARSAQEVRIDTTGPTAIVADGKPVAELEAVGRARRFVLRGAPEAPWSRTRAVLLELALDTSAHDLTVGDGTRELLVGLPRGDRADGATRLVVVDVLPDRSIWLGVERHASIAAFRDAVAGLRTVPARFLLRGQDGARFGDVLDTAIALEAAAPGSVILGAISREFPQKRAGWLECPFPPGREDEMDVQAVEVRLDVRDDGRVGEVRILRSSDPMFTSAAVYCASRQILTAKAGKRNDGLRVRFRRWDP